MNLPYLFDSSRHECEVTLDGHRVAHLRFTIETDYRIHGEVQWNREDTDAIVGPFAMGAFRDICSQTKAAEIQISAQVSIANTTIVSRLRGCWFTRMPENNPDGKNTTGNFTAASWKPWHLPA